MKRLPILLALLAGCGGSNESGFDADLDEPENPYAADEAAEARFKRQLEQEDANERRRDAQAERDEERQLARLQESELLDAEQYASEFFRNRNLHPELTLPDDFSEPELVPADRELIESIEAGLAGEGWDRLVRATHPDMPPEEMEVGGLLRESCFVADRPLRFVASADDPLSDRPRGMIVVYRRADGLDFNQSVARHPDGRWVFQCPFGAIDGFAFYPSQDVRVDVMIHDIVLNTRDEVVRIRSVAEQLKDLREEPLSDEELESRISAAVQEGYEAAQEVAREQAATDG